MVSSLHGTVLAAIGVAAPYVDDGFAVDVDGDGGADLAAAR